jgi:hypothetical protein
VKPQGRNETDHPSRHPLDSFNEGLVVISVEGRGGIEPAPELSHLLPADEAAEIFAGIARSDKLTRAEYPETVGSVASFLLMRCYVTFFTHLSRYGKET